MLSSCNCVLTATLLISSLSVTPKIDLRKRICAASSRLLSFALNTQVSLPHFRASFDIILCNHNCSSCLMFFPMCLLMHTFNLLYFCTFSSKSSFILYTDILHPKYFKFETCSISRLLLFLSYQCLVPVLPTLLFS
jgi:hypothetical protein